MQKTVRVSFSAGTASVVFYFRFLLHLSILKSKAETNKTLQSGFSHMCWKMRIYATIPRTFADLGENAKRWWCDSHTEWLAAAEEEAGRKQSA